MIYGEQGTAPVAPRLEHHHHHFATLAHQKAGQVVALREAAGQIHDGMTAADARLVLLCLVDKIELDIALMGAGGVGHG